MQISFGVNERTLYVRLSEEGRAHLYRYYQDSRRRFALDDSTQRDADRHQIWRLREPSGWWQFSAAELLAIFGGLVPEDVFEKDSQMRLTNPVEDLG